MKSAAREGGPVPKKGIGASRKSIGYIVLWIKVKSNVWASTGEGI